MPERSRTAERGNEQEKPARGFVYRLSIVPALVMIAVLFGGLATGIADTASAASTEIRVGSELDFPPYAFVGQNGEAGGFSVDLIKAVARAMGLPIAITTGPWDQVWTGLTTGQLDILPIVARSPERQRLVDFSLPHTETFDAFFVRQGDPPFPDIEAATGKEIVVMHSDAAHHQLEALRFKGPLTLVQTIPEGLSLVASGKHDAFLCSKLIGTMAINEHAIKGLIAGPPVPDYKRVFSFAVKKGDLELVEKLNQGLMIVKTNGEYDRIYEKWLTADDPWLRWKPYLLPTIAGVTTFGLILTFWLLMLKVQVRRHTRELAETNAMLVQARENLEERVVQRTAELGEANAALQLEVAERKLVEEELRENQSRLDLALRSAQMGVWHLDIAEDRRVFDDQVYRLLGIDAERFAGTADGFFDAVHPDDRNLVRAALAQTIEHGKPYEIEYRTLWPDASIHHISARGRLDYDGEGRPVRLNGLIWDISERKQAEEAVRESEERFRVAQELSPDGFSILRPMRDAQGRVVDFTWVYANATTELFVGMPLPSLVGQSLLDLFPGHYDSPLFRTYQQVAETGQPCVQEALYPGDGILAQRWVRVAVVSMGKDIAVLSQDTTERRRMEEELRQSHSELELKVQERTQELQVNNKALMQYATKLERLNQELEEFAFVASHDLQEPLRKIRTFGDMLMKDHKGNLDEKAQAHLMRIMGSAKRMSDSIHSLLNYSRLTSEPSSFELVDLTVLAQDAVSDLEGTINQAGGTIEISGLPAIEADGAQIRHLFKYLLENSLKYRKESEFPVVRINGQLSGGTCTIFIEDNGIGFEEHYIDRIFRPFQQLHSRGKFEGTGMGLALCRKIVERHEGSITARSLPGQGSTFIVRLPAAQRERG